MSLYTKLEMALKTARKLGNTVQANYLRVFVGDLQTKEKKGIEINDELILRDIKKVIANLNDNASRVEDPEVFLDEATFWEGYMPKQLDEEQLRVVIVNFVQDFGAPKNPGPIMKFLKENYAGQYDGKLAASVAGKVMSGN